MVARRAGARHASKETRTRTPATPGSVSATSTRGASGTSLEGIAAEAEKLIADHISSHEMEDQGQEWLSIGASFVIDETCPFCGQSTVGIALVSAYQALFSDAYNRLKDEVQAILREILAE